MNAATETITVINRRTNTQTGYDEWIPTVITGASWYSKQVASVTTSGLKTADTLAVRIPVSADTGGRTYMTPTAYKAAESVSGAFTLGRGDLIVRGTVSVQQGQTLKPADVQQTHEDYFTITSVSDNTRRPRAPHWKVVGA